MKKFFKGLGKKSLSKHGSRESVGSLKYTDSNTVAGYDIRDKDLNKLHKAAWNGDIGKVRQLSRKDPSPLDKDNRTPLHLACVKGHRDIVQELLEWKAKTNVGDNQAKTPLMKAVECHQTSCVQLLLDYNTEVNARDPNSETVLHYAVKDNQLQIVVILLQSGADANVQNKEGYAPLHLAVLQGLDDIADALLRDGANIDLHDAHQKTPLIIAGQEGNISMIKILLQHNADVFLTESRGWTASDVAVMNGHQDCEAILHEHRLRLKKQISEDDAVPSGNSADSPRGATAKDVQFGVPAANVDADDSGDETFSKASGGAGGGNDSWGDDTDISLATDDKPKMLRIKLRANKRKATNSNDSPSIPQNEMEVTNINNTNNNPSIPQGTLSHSVSSSAKSMRTKRETLKENPTAWAEHKAREAARQRERRKNRSIQQKQRDTETARLRQAKFSTKRAAVGIDDHTNSKKKVKILTRTEKTKQREHWSEQQKSCRGKQSAQKKRRIREKDAYRHRLKRTQNTCKKSNSKNCPVETTEVQQTSFPTDSAKRKALSRMWSHMPRDPEKFAEVISTCIEGRRTTPRKRAALVAKGILSPSKCKQKLKFRQETWKKLHSSVQLLKKRSDDFARRDCRNLLASLMVSKKYRSQRMLSQTVGVTPNYLTNIRKRLTTTDTRTDDKKRRMRRKRSDVTCQDVIANVQQAYRSPVISRELPIMRRTAKPNLTPQRIMEVTISKAYKIWKKDNQDIRVSSSLFQKLRPDDVLLLRRNSFVQCLCEYCTDIMFLLHCLNHTAQMCGHKDTQLKDKYALIAATMCPKPEANRYGARDCISRSCDHCGVKLMKERYHKLLDESGQQQVIWKAWESKSYVHDGKTKSKKVLTTKSGSLQDLINELVDATKPLAKHLFVASWQQEMFSTISKHVPDSSVVIVCDFAENYTCVNQDEIQSAHWAQNQVTVHPIVCYYNCPDHNNHVVQEAIVIISSDIKHDAHAVNHFKHIAVTHLKEKRNVLFEKVIEFTDDCSNQYKSKIPFADISFSKQDMGVQLERHFFGSRHGKGPSDGVSGVVKSAVRRAVVSRQALVNNAVDMFGYCESNLTKNDCTSQMRTFFLVGDEDVIRERPERMVKSPVVGTLQFQAVKSVEPGVIGVRLLSCFCRNCLSDDGLCENSSYTHPWQQRVLKLVLPPPPEIIPETVITNLVVNIPVSESELALSDIWKSLTDGVQDEVPEDAYTEDLFRMLDEDSKKIPHVSATETVQPDDKPSKQTPDIAIVPEKYYAVDYIDRFYIGRVLTDKGAKWDMKFLHQAAPKISLAKFVPSLSEEDNGAQHEGSELLNNGYAEDGWSKGLPPISAQEASKIMEEPKLSIQRDSLITMKSQDEDDSPRTIRRKVSFKRDEELSEIHNISALDEDASDKGSTTGMAQMISDGPPKSVSPEPPVGKMSQERMKALMEELGISDVEDVSEADISENLPAKADDQNHDDSDWDSTVASEVVPAKPGILKNWKQTSSEQDDGQIDTANGQPIHSSFYQMGEEISFEPPTKLKQAKPLDECDWDSNAADDKVTSEKEVSEFDSDISDMLSPRDRGKLVRQCFHSEEEIAELMDSLSERRNMLPLSQELELTDNSHRCGDNAQYTDEEESDWDSAADGLTPREPLPRDLAADGLTPRELLPHTRETIYSKQVSEPKLPASIPELLENEPIYENTKSAKDEALHLDALRSDLVVDKLETTDELDETSLKLGLHEHYDVDLTKRKHVSESNKSTSSMIPEDNDEDKWDESDDEELSAHEDMFGFLPEPGAPPLPMSPPPDYLSPRDGGDQEEVDSGDEEEEESISEWEIERNKIKAANLEKHDEFLEGINNSFHEEIHAKRRLKILQFQVASKLVPKDEKLLSEDFDEQDELKDNFDITINSLPNVTAEKADQPDTTGQIVPSTSGQTAAVKTEEEPVSKGHKIIATKLKMSLHSDGNSYDEEEDSMMSGFDSPRNQRGELGVSGSNGYMASLLGTSAGVGLYSGAPVDDDGLSYTSTEDLTGDLSSTRITQQNILGRDMIQSMNTRDTTSMLKVQEHMRDQKRQVEREKAQKTLLENKHRVLSKEKTEMQRKLEELTSIKSGLEQSKLDLEARIRALEYNLSEEVEKKKNAELLLKKTKEQLDRKEQQYTSEIEGKQRAELTMRNLQMELRSSQNTIKQLEDEKVELDRQMSHERSARQLQEHINEEQQRLQQQLQQETEMSVVTQAEVFQKLELSDEGRKSAQSSSEKLSAEVYALKMELDRQRSRFKDDHAMATSENEELLSKIEDLKNEIKLNEDALAHATMKFNVELSSMRTENSMVSSSLEKERSAKEKYETELESLRSRLQTTSLELEKAQGARTEIERNIQRDRDEWTKQQERRDLELTTLKDSNQNMQDRLHSTDAKLTSVENELHTTNSSMLEKNNSLAQLQREIEHRHGQQDTLNENYRKEKDVSTKLQVKLESLQDRLSGAQHENLSLKQQLDTAQQGLRDQHGAGSDANDKFNLMLTTIRADQDKGHSALEDKNASLNEMVARLKEELRNSDNRRSTLDQDLRRLNTDHNDIIKKLSMAEASLEIAQKFKDQLESERNQMKLDMERLDARYQAAHEKSVESQVRVSDLMERLQRAEQEAVCGRQELTTTSANSQAIAKSMDEMGESVHRLEVDNARMEAELGYEKEKVEMLQRDLDDSQKVRNSLEALCSSLKSVNVHIGDKLEGEETTRNLLLQETEDTKDLWEREVLSRSKLGLKIAQLERQKQDLQAQLDEERRKVRKVVDAKRVIEARLDAETQKNNQLQKDVTNLKRHIKTAKMKLTNDDSDLNINALSSDYSKEWIDSENDPKENTVKKLRKQLEDVHDQLEADGAQRERMSSKNKELQLELGSMRGLEKSVMKLEKTKKKLEEEFAIYKSQVKVTDMEQIRREMEGQYRMELNRKLDEVNRYLEEQSQARDRLDRVRANNENALKTEKRKLEEDITELHMKFEQSLAQKETQSMETKRFRELYDNELKWRVQLNDQMQKSAEKALSYKSKLSSERQRSRLYGSWNNLTLNGGMDTGGASMEISRISMSPEKDALNSKLKAELDRSIAKHLEAAPHDNLRPVIRNNDEVLNTSSSLHKANTDYLEVLRRKYLV